MGEKQDGGPSVPSDEVRREIWTCQNCLKSSDNKPELKWLMCALCEGKFDSKCQNVKANQVSALTDRKDMFWVCQICMPKYCPDPNRRVLKLTKKTPDEAQGKPKEIDLNTLFEKIEEVRDAQLSIEATINTIHTDVIETAPKSISEDVQEKIEAIQESLSTQLKNSVEELPAKIEQRPTFAAILKTDGQPRAPNPVSVNDLKQALIEATEEDKEKELRSRGIVVYRAPEKVRADNEPQQKDVDEQLIKGLVRFLECDPEEISSVDRLGRFSTENIGKERYRPLKVRFKTNKTRDEVLASLSKLRHSDEHLKKLSIRQDLNLQQRTELNNKIKEAKELSQSRPDFVFRVRGTPGNYKLVEFKRNQQPQNPGDHQQQTTEESGDHQRPSQT